MAGVLESMARARKVEEACSLKDEPAPGELLVR